MTKKYYKQKHREDEQVQDKDIVYTAVSKEGTGYMVRELKPNSGLKAEVEFLKVMSRLAKEGLVSDLYKARDWLLNKKYSMAIDMLEHLIDKTNTMMHPLDVFVEAPGGYLSIYEEDEEKNKQIKADRI